MSQELGEAALPLSHCPTMEVFLRPPFLMLSRLLAQWGHGPWAGGHGPWAGGEWSLGWGEWSLGWRMIPGVEGMVPGIAPRDRSPVLEAAQCRSSKPKVGQSRFSGSSQRSDPSQNLLEPSMPQFPKL